MANISFWGRLFLMMAIAFVINTIIYFSFANVYSSSILNIQSFENQFSSGVYQYRVLSGYFFFWIYDFLGTLDLNYQIFKLKFLNPESESQVYLAFYSLNTIFLLATVFVLNLILECEQLMINASEKLFLNFIVIFIIGLTQFIIVPYDVSSYFFLLLFFFVFLKYLEKKSVLKLIFLSIIIIISTLNRETAALSLSLAASLLIFKEGISIKSIKPLVPLVLSFLLVYVGLRYLNKTFTTNDGNLLLQNFTNPKNILGIVAWLVLFAFSMMLSKSSANRKLIFLYHGFALPYILMCFFSGILYEVRLYVPLFLVSILLAFIKTNNVTKF
ncbi:hypothetical protein [Frigoriflavimonas asaccharolytica]|uniref:Uncharacterized protein n=1 Tax=Frigoriflavimonas asaccharolytica TaxID=2735899 RepID=A0A8J8G717_9FLAO|nr:hypothetical protein [Frigoriflavimonas asaccharolytica]NRS92683.1 hypothetical protein [Frigoriflavimonas asaccharolytica]